MGRWTDWATGPAVTALSTVACYAMREHFAMADLVMIYLLGVTIVALSTNLYASIFTAILATLSFDFFFVPPYWAFSANDVRHFVTLGVMLFVAVLISGLTERTRRQAEATHDARAEAETEHLRNALLRSVSHDLRTPLTAITGAATTLLDGGATLDPPTQHDLAETIREEADHLNRLLGNLLHMTRLESGVQVQKEWQPVEEAVGTALGRLESRLRGRPIISRFPGEVPSAPFDGVLIEQVLVNLIENAVRYTPERTPVEISAWATEAETMVEVADLGPGIRDGEHERIFDKFYRGTPRAGDGGVGLGLTISRAIVRAHGGQLWVENRPGGGAAFRFTLPHDDTPPPAEGPLPELEGAPVAHLHRT
jgi:K+-sensing histidine kinase KdpD